MTPSKEPAGPGRPREFDRDQALGALTILFWQKGYESTTQQDMVECTGLSSSSLLNAFGNKPAIFRHVLENYMMMQRQGLSILTDGEEGIADLMSFFDRIEAHVSGQLACPKGCLAVKTMTGPLDVSEPINDLLQSYRDNLAYALRTVFQRALARGEVLEENIENYVQMLTASFIGIMATAESAPSSEVAQLMVQSLRKSFTT